MEAIRVGWLREEFDHGPYFAVSGSCRDTSKAAVRVHMARLGELIGAGALGATASCLIGARPRHPHGSMRAPWYRIICECDPDPTGSVLAHPHSSGLLALSLRAA